MNSFRHILSLIKTYRFNAFLNLIFNAVAVLFSLVSLTMVAPFLGILFDKIQPTLTAPELSLNVESIINYFNYQLGAVIAERGKISGLLFICFVVITVFLIKNVFRYLALYVLAPIRNGVVKDLRQKIYDRILHLPISYFSDKRKGDLLSRASIDVVEVEWGVMSVLEVFFKEPLTIILYLGALFYISSKMTLLVLLILPISGFFIAKIGKSLKRVSSQAQDKQSNLLSILEETIGGLRIVKAFTAEESQQNKFKTQNQIHNDLMNKVLWRKELASPLTEVLAILMVVVVLYVGGKVVLDGESILSAESFITFMLIFSQIINPAKAFATAYYRVVKGIASMERIEEILDEESMPKTALNIEHNKQELTDFENKIEYRNVFFSFDDQPNMPVLHDINAIIPKGKTIALVGPSGAGKSTFVDMLPRFFEVRMGAILIDGTDIREIKKSSLRQLIGNVTQQAILFNDTIFNNIALGKDDATEAEVIQAAKIANAHRFIEKMENGYHTNIGDSGNKLSGGERQRLTIARAILKNPPILILDEATSSLDAESEKLVQDALLKLMENRTSIVIAHRLSTIRNADEIWVMQKGEIVERGNHASLMKEGNVYYNLASLQ